MNVRMMHRLDNTVRMVYMRYFFDSQIVVVVVVVTMIQLYIINIKLENRLFFYIIKK